jgi:hypothetical protein
MEVLARTSYLNMSVRRFRLELGFLSGSGGVGNVAEVAAVERPGEGDIGKGNVGSSLSSPSVILPKMSLLTS